MQKQVVVLNSRDDVANALVDLERGARVEVFIPEQDVQEVVLQDSVPLGHKFALRRIPAGSHVVKFGIPIGIATQDIEQGEHVHVHNLE